MAFIGKMISDNQKKHEDANKAAIEGTNALMSAEDKYWANKTNNEKNAKKTVEESVTQRVTTTEQFLKNDPRGKKIAQEGMTGSTGDFFVESVMAKRKDIQDRVQALIAEDLKKNSSAAASPKDTTFKGPEGFSNVIGVGANPVLENLTRQTDIQQQILEFLKTKPYSSGITDVDFTKNPIDIRNVS